MSQAAREKRGHGREAVAVGIAGGITLAATCSQTLETIVPEFVIPPSS